VTVDMTLFTPPGDYVVRAKDDMEDIHAGDYLVIARATEARKGQMVLAGGVVRRFGKKDALGVDGIVVGLIRHMVPR
jgi:SOS-response transcriptional repressor LexA